MADKGHRRCIGLVLRSRYHTNRASRGIQVSAATSMLGRQLSAKRIDGVLEESGCMALLRFIEQADCFNHMLKSALLIPIRA